MLKLVMRNGDVFVGETFRELVCDMKDTPMFRDVKNVLGYVASFQGLVEEMEGFERDVTGAKMRDHCEVLVRRLVRDKAAVLEDTRPALTPLARLVRMCADVLYDGDLEVAWPLVRKRMRLTDQEQRDVVEQLGLNTSDLSDPHA